MSKKIKITGNQYRTVTLTRAEIDEEARTANLAFSSEEPVERWFGMEVLDHSKKSVRLGRLKDGAPLLIGHDADDHVGVVEKVSLDSDKVGRAVVRFGRSARAEEIFQDVLDGIRRKVSVGYLVHKTETIEEKNGSVPIVRVVDWEPFEISMVSVPADNTVGIGRDLKTQNDNDKENEMPLTTEEKEKIAREEREKVIAEQKREKDREAELERVRAEEREKVKKETREKEQERQSIETIGEKHNRRDLAKQAIRDGKSLSEFREMLIDSLESAPMSNSVTDVGMSRKEKGQYSLLRAINAAASKDWSKAGLEQEISQAIAKERGKDPKGFFVPHSMAWKESRAQRDLTTGVAADGGNLVGTDHMGGEFIDALREALVLRSLGVRIMSGLQGDVAIPGLNARTATAWVAENNAPTEGAPTFRQVTMSPKSVSTYVDMSRRLILQSDPSVENVVRSDIVAQIAAAIDAAGINGGGSNEPTGILQTAGIGSVSFGTPNGGAPNWDGIVELVGDVDIANALMGNLWFLTNAAAVSKLRRTVKVASTDSRMILDDQANSLFGYDIAQTNLVPSNLVEGTSGATLSAMIFGNFRDLIIGEWGVLDVLVNPYILDTIGAVRVRVFMDVDVAVRHPASFSAAQDMITT